MESRHYALPPQTAMRLESLRTATALLIRFAVVKCSLVVGSEDDPGEW